MAYFLYPLIKQRALNQSVFFPTQLMYLNKTVVKNALKYEYMVDYTIESNINLNI